MGDIAKGDVEITLSQDTVQTYRIVVFGTGLASCPSLI